MHTLARVVCMYYSRVGVCILFFIICIGMYELVVQLQLYIYFRRGKVFPFRS